MPVFKNTSGESKQVKTDYENNSFNTIEPGDTVELSEEHGENLGWEKVSDEPEEKEPENDSNTQGNEGNDGEDEEPETESLQEYAQRLPHIAEGRAETLSEDYEDKQDFVENATVEDLADVNGLNEDKAQEIRDTIDEFEKETEE